jgi:hypothetical protein
MRGFHDILVAVRKVGIRISTRIHCCLISSKKWGKSIRVEVENDSQSHFTKICPRGRHSSADERRWISDVCLSPRHTSILISPLTTGLTMRAGSSVTRSSSPGSTPRARGQACERCWKRKQKVCQESTRRGTVAERHNGIPVIHLGTDS